MSGNEAYEFHDAYEPPDDEPIAAVVKPVAPALPVGHSSEADFPYNPDLRVEMQVGLDKLRCIADRGQAAALYLLYVSLEPKWKKGGEAAKWREEDERAREDADLERLQAIADGAFMGRFGDEAKQLAQHLLMSEGYKPQRRTDLPALREFDLEFRKLRRPHR